MSFIYTRTQFKSRINAGIQGRIGVLVDEDETANAAVRSVLNEVDLRSTKRGALLSPKLFNGEYNYAQPSDIKKYKLVDIPAQAKRSDGQWDLVTAEEFDRTKAFNRGMLAFDSYDSIRTLKISSNVDDLSLVLSPLSGITSSGTWTAFGDLTGIASDTDDYVKGSGSIKGNISAAGGTTCGIQTSNLNSADITNYLGGNSSVFIWVEITDPTNITNYILRLGSSSSSYYSKTVTAQNDGTAFTSGWNLLRFDLSSLTTVGTPTVTAITYAAIYFTKTAGKISESDYKFNWLTVKKGVIHNLRYYSKYGWQSSAGAYKENSTDELDVLVADTDEIDMYIHRGVSMALRELAPLDNYTARDLEWKQMVKDYQMSNPSEAMIITSEYYNYLPDYGNGLSSDSNNGRIRNQ